MTTVFADTYYYLALIGKADQGHLQAVEFATSFRGRTITTEWILTEVGDASARSQNRSIFLQLFRSLADDVNTEIVEASHELFARGVELFARRSDKDWSLTDCISFVVMHEHGIHEALTGDRHFEQAGYTALLA